MFAMAPKLWSSVLVWTTSRFKCFSSLRIAFGILSGEVEASVNDSFDGLCESRMVWGKLTSLVFVLVVSSVGNGSGPTRSSCVFSGAPPFSTRS